MFLPPEFQSRKTSVLFKEDYENSPGHAELTERLCKTLYYGKHPNAERPSLPVTELCVEFFQEATPRGLGRVDPFFASSVGRRACISPCSMMLGMIYIERLKKRNPDYLQTVSSSDLFLISMMVASKYLYDEGVDEEVFNDEWAESAKIDTDDVNDLEVNFLAAIDWSLFVKPGEFQEMLHNVERKIALQQGFDRGWFSYMDLLVLMEDEQLCDVMRSIILGISKVMVVCSVAYIAGALTLVGASVSLVYVRTHLPPPVLGPESIHHIMSAPNIQKQPHDTVDKHDVQSNIEVNVTSESFADVGNSVNGTTETKSDNHDAARHNLEETEHTSRLSLPGLVTLVLIRDTVSNVLVSMFGRSQQMLSHDSTNLPGWVEGCSCNQGPCVSNKDSSNCRNFSSVLDYEQWCLSCLEMFGNGFDHDLVYNRHLHQLPGRQRIPKTCSSHKMLTLNVFPICCCSNEMKMWDRGGPKVNDPFSDIMIGFGTTVKPV